MWLTYRRGLICIEFSCPSQHLNFNILTSFFELCRAAILLRYFCFYPTESWNWTWGGAPYCFYILLKQQLISSYLLSEDNPAVAIKDDELMKTKSLAVLLWHCQVWKMAVYISLIAKKQILCRYKSLDLNRKAGCF